MKKSIFFLAFQFFLICLSAQTPQAIKYQAVARDNSGNLVANQNIGFRISILQGSPTGPSVFSETHNVASNTYGLVNFEIGAGSPVSGSMVTINWGASTFYVKMEMDVTGGSNYLFMGTSQLLSVPYALFAEKANSVVNGVAGPTGPTGASGANGLNGATGPTGPTGSGGGGGTLDLAYDFGGPGLGRAITTDAGAVQINNSGTNTIGLEVNSAVNNSTAVLANVNGVGVGFRAESTNPSNTFASIQANTNSSNAQNSAILGNNSGGGYGISGQIPSTAGGLAAVYGNNLRTTGGYGVYGQGVNGVVGQTNYPNGFGVYGGNTNTNGGTTTNLGVGVYGIGFNGVYGQTTNTTLGWAGYFTADLGCDGAGYALGGWINASDRRLKSDIKKIDNALKKVSQLDGRFYTITTKSSGTDGKIQQNSRQQYGVIAQDVEKIFPEMVTEKAIFSNTGDDTKYKTVEYTQLIPVLIEAVKELNLKVDELQKEVDRLKSPDKK